MSRKQYQRMFVLYWQRHKLLFWFGLAVIVNQKCKNKIYKLRKLDDRIQILQLARSRNKRQKETEI